MRGKIQMAGNSHHVVTNSNGGWSVKRDGSERAIKNFGSRDSAIDFGKKVSRNACSELVIHRKDGTIQSKVIEGQCLNALRG